MKLPPIAPWLALLTVLAPAGCSSVKTAPSGEGARYEAKPKGCSLEFLEKAPGRGYEELGELQEHVTAPPPGGAAEALRDRACALGADALIITRHVVTNAYGHVLVAGTAIKYVERAQAPEPEPEQPKAPRSGAVDL
jgi:hypothetical protein